MNALKKLTLHMYSVLAHVSPVRRTVEAHSLLKPPVSRFPLHVKLGPFSDLQIDVAEPQHLFPSTQGRISSNLRPSGGFKTIVPKRDPDQPFHSVP